jgi:sensor histidine kinase regulating citrate/malate metabolism
MLIFQIGALVFIVQLALVAARFIKDATDALSEKQMYELRLESLNRVVDEQRKQNDHLIVNAEKIRAMRHDLRHQLNVLRSFSEAGDLEGISNYINQVSDSLPRTATESYCENHAVNAVVGYYIALAESEGVSVDAKLEIPEKTGRVHAVDLCVILGNLLENAINGLRSVKTGEKYIRARAKTINETLSLIIENNFDGLWEQDNGVYISRNTSEGRREGEGLVSVEAICKKYDGFIRVEPVNNTWRVSVQVNTAE